MGDELKPCPWCGAAGEHLEISGRDYMVSCLKCEATGPVSGTDAEALLAWNSRAPDPQLTAALTAIRDAVTYIDAFTPPPGRGDVTIARRQVDALRAVLAMGDVTI